MNYTSIKSVLYDLALTIPRKDWNERTMIEWALKALFKVNSPKLYEDKFKLLLLDDHTIKLPEDVRHINQIIYYDDNLDNYNKDWLEKIIKGKVPTTAKSLFKTESKWKPLKINTSTFSKMLLCDDTWHSCNSEYEYTIDNNLILTTNLKNKIICVSYKGYKKNNKNEYEIHDDEDLKEAISHYCLYRYAMTKSWNSTGDIQLTRIMNEKIQFHLKMYEVLKAKYAAKSNSPSIDQLENIKRMNSRILNSFNTWKKLFTNLNNIEKINHI